MMFRLAAVICFLFAGLRAVGIAMELARKQWGAASIDGLIAGLLIGMGIFLWKLYRRLIE